MAPSFRLCWILWREGCYQKFFQKQHHHRHKSPGQQAQGRERFHWEDSGRWWKRCPEAGASPWRFSRREEAKPWRSDLARGDSPASRAGGSEPPAHAPLRQLRRGFMNLSQTCDTDQRNLISLFRLFRGSSTWERNEARKW